MSCFDFLFVIKNCIVDVLLPGRLMKSPVDLAVAPSSDRFATKFLRFRAGNDPNKLLLLLLLLPDT